MKQEVTRQNKAKQWSLDDVDYHSDVLKEVIQTDDGRVDRNLPSPPDGVLIHGLYLEGASWDRQGRKLEPSNPKELFCTFPVMHVTAVSGSAGPGPGMKGKPDDKYAEKGMYDCPVYKYPKRTDKYLIFRVKLRCDGGNQASMSRTMNASMVWKLQGVALLCSKE